VMSGVSITVMPPRTRVLPLMTVGSAVSDMVSSWCSRS
jgi:hypothetical protein